ncbi:Translationally-controlled tumor protein [Hibiscus syriacus]|uniref:Translationally-controlled tumor protein n=1 Tax=Hibiscus syriacus TaxID=106335 RepID=A0A6A2ZQX4_HIBSY|nr:non-specific lipid transfer protein GPI-anchored 8-like [Hibiscus syriacus]KAE8694314.1 Translationally-controlled tumor protein [Hibiscus syriacus]
MAKFLIMAVLLAVVSTATVTDAQATCAQKLVGCAAYINNATVKPGDDCCNPIKEAVRTELPCLCNLYKDPNFLPSLHINVSDALRVSRECGVGTDLSNCNNSTSPTSPPSPPGRGAVNQDGGADRISLTGLTIFFLLFISIALY